MTVMVASRPPVPVTRPRVSVVICAYTEARWDQTRAAVDSVRTQSLPAEEIIVVDHNPGFYVRLGTGAS